MGISVDDLIGPQHATLAPEEALEAALRYLELGWAVIPGPGLDEGGQCTCYLGERCKKNAGKHAYAGWGNDKRRTITADEARALWAGDNERWKTHPVDQVFIVPYLSGLIVADIDSMGAWERVEDKPETLRQRSGSGRGEHWLYRFEWDTDKPDPPRVRGQLPHLAGEVRFRGIIAAAPSVHASGGRYEWLNWDRRQELVPAPEWMITPVHSVWDEIEPGVVGGFWADALLSVELESARGLGRMASDRPGGGRPGAIFAVAARLGRFCRAGLLDIEQARELLYESARENGALRDYGLDEISRHIENGLHARRRGT